MSDELKPIVGENGAMGIRYPNGDTLYLAPRQNGVITHGIYTGESTGLDAESFLLVRNGQNTVITDPELLQKIKDEVGTVLADGAISMIEQNHLNYVIDDVLDDRQLNNSAPGKPEGPIR